MKKTIIGIAALISITGCGDKTVPTGTVSVAGTSSTTTATTPTPSATTPAKPPTTNICVKTDVPLDSTWPLDEAMKSWNQNGKNILTYYPDRCDGYVLIVMADNREWWGKTAFDMDAGGVILSLSTSSPTEFREHVVCHELGHVLGLAHTDDNTCMNIHKMSPVPSREEIQAAGAKPWKFEIAARHSLGE